MLGLVVTVAALAQAPVGATPVDPLPPPPPLLDGSSERVPAARAPPPASTPTPTPTPRPRPVRPDERRAPAPLDPVLVGCLQALVPCSVSVVGMPCALIIAAVVPGGACVACLLPAASGYAATILGDRLGPSRAPALWPVVASYVAAVAGVVSAATLYTLLAGGGGGGAGDPALYGLVVAGAAVAAVGVAAVPVSYALTAEKKHDGDDGTGAPGFLSPGHPDAQAMPY